MTSANRIEALEQLRERASRRLRRAQREALDEERDNTNV
jgi:hypothetical protein